MKREIKLHNGTITTVDDSAYKVMEYHEWLNEGKNRFGEDFLDWKFQCPMCGHISSIREFKEAGADNLVCAYQECIGRYMGKGSPKEGDSSGCNWTAYGSFEITNGKGIIVIGKDGLGIKIYDFANIN